MEELETTQTTETVEQTPEEMVKEMKETMVPRAELEVMTKKYNNLFKNYINNKTPEQPELSIQEIEKQKIDEFNSNVLNKPKTNIAQMERIMKIRDYLLEQGKGDIFCTNPADPESVNSATKQADLINYALERAQGSETIFNGTIQEHLKDNIAMNIKKKR